MSCFPDAGARGATRPALCAVLIALYVFAGRARAQEQGPFFEAQALPRTGYDLRLRAAYYAATRSDFAAPVFLFAQPVQRIAAKELHIELDLRLALSPRLALQAVVPLCVRVVDAQLQPVLISQRQQLPGVALELSNVGLSDPTLGLAYRVLRSTVFDGYVETGARISLDDDPGGLTLPSRVPLGTGQTQLRLGAGAVLRAGPLSASAAYRLEYEPGNAAAYLIHRVGPQGYTSGSLDARVGHRVTAQAAYALGAGLSARLTPEWSVTEVPKLITSKGAVTWLGGDWLQEVTLSAELRWQFEPQQSLALSVRAPLLASFQHDPFFPIAMPARGVGVTWQATGF